MGCSNDDDDEDDVVEVNDVDNNAELRADNAVIPLFCKMCVKYQE